jgi:hypothetical protein
MLKGLKVTKRRHSKDRPKQRLKFVKYEKNYYSSEEIAKSCNEAIVAFMEGSYAEFEAKIVHLNYIKPRQIITPTR